MKKKSHFRYWVLFGWLAVGWHQYAKEERHRERKTDMSVEEFMLMLSSSASKSQAISKTQLTPVTEDRHPQTDLTHFVSNAMRMREDVGVSVGKEVKEIM
jgi:hypothetical protein